MSDFNVIKPVTSFIMKNDGRSAVISSNNTMNQNINKKKENIDFMKFSLRKKTLNSPHRVSIFSFPEEKEKLRCQYFFVIERHDKAEIGF